MKDVLEELERWQSAGEDIAIATLVSAWGSAPRPPGARFAATRSGKIAGSLSGGCVEGDVYERAMEVLATGQARLLRYGISDETAFGVGLSCGGSIEVFVQPFRADEAWSAARDAIAGRQACALVTVLAPDAAAGERSLLFADAGAAVSGRPLSGAVEHIARGLARDGGTAVVESTTDATPERALVEGFPPPPILYIIGATHLAIALCRQAKMLGFGVTVIDPRRVFATRERFPDADNVIAGWPDDALNESLDADSFVVVLTHDMKFDVPALDAALRADVRYVGLLGSRPTLDERMRALRERGFDDAALARIHAPVGLDLGGRSPEEIALAIVAEMTAVRHGRLRASAGTAR